MVPSAKRRLKATLQRLRRLTEKYSQMMLDAYAERAAIMGKALGLETERYLGGWGGRDAAVKAGQQLSAHTEKQTLRQTCTVAVQALLCSPEIWLLPGHSGFTPSWHSSCAHPLASARSHSLGGLLLPAAVFTEAEIRASLVFQLSKLSSLLIKVGRSAAGVPLWPGHVLLASPEPALS